MGLASVVFFRLDTGNMSLSHVLKNEKKYGFPVVFTDSEGHDPYVLLPFDQFDAMMSGSLSSEVVMPRVVEDVIEDEMETQRNTKIQSTAETLEKSSPIFENSAVLSEEEKFYLEPIDDEV